ncbi:site-specific DNA-methyltransferase [Candidatus Poribacteria bacterium]|nr:site-specific DNA-methyltransferase [Candidatus Poribacteria bacterium]
MTVFEETKVGNGKIIKGDCLSVMDELPDDHFILGFTSPPYLNAINYDAHVEKLHGAKERWEREDISYEEYRNFLVNRFKALLRIIKPGGHNVVNIAPVLWNGMRTALPFHFVNWLEDIGWRFKEDIVWEKPIARDRRSGVLLQHPYPGYYYPSLVAEYIFVFQKPADKKGAENIYWDRSDEEKKRNRIDLKDYQGEMSKNVWKIRPLSPQENLHPCPFPLELAERVIQLYSYKGDSVIDIFAGSGQTNCAAEKLGRAHVGIETQQEYIDYAADRLHSIVNQGQIPFIDIEE